MQVPLGQQGLRQLPQEALEERGNIVVMEVTGGEVDVGAAVELLSQHLLSQAVPRNPKQTLHMQICTTTTSSLLYELNKGKI